MALGAWGGVHGGGVRRVQSPPSRSGSAPYTGPLMAKSHAHAACCTLVDTLHLYFVIYDNIYRNVYMILQYCMMSIEYSCMHHHQ